MTEIPASPPGGKARGRGPSAFKQSDVTRVIKGVIAAGLNVVSAEISRDKIVVRTDKAEPDDGNSNPWDKALSS